MVAKLGTTQRPARVRVQTQEKAEHILAVCHQHGWQVILGIEPDEPDDLTDFDRLMHPPAPVIAAKAPGRNDPCSCGSGKKYKKCHGA